MITIKINKSVKANLAKVEKSSLKQCSKPIGQRVVQTINHKCQLVDLKYEDSITTESI
jgi:hypothetical protein